MTSPSMAAIRKRPVPNSIISWSLWRRAFPALQSRAAIGFRIQRTGWPMESHTCDHRGASLARTIGPLIIGVGNALVGADEAGAHLNAGCAKREGGCQPTPVAQATCSDHRHADTASTTGGTSAIVVTEPICPPDSSPSAITASAPDAPGASQTPPRQPPE